MNADKALGIVSSIVTVAMVTVVVSHPTTVGIIKASGQAFASSLRAAMGR